jgi:hypothetical protein
MLKTDTHAPKECCSDGPCDSGLRNQYFEGKRLTVDSFRVEQKYQLERRRLLNRAIHGWGVVQGYAIGAGEHVGSGSGGALKGLEIGAGLALDKCGRELLLAHAVRLDVGDLLVLDDKYRRIGLPPPESRTPGPGKAGHDAGPRACWLLSAHYAEQLVSPMKVNDPCSCERHEWEHVCETVRFSLRRIDCKHCCDECECELECGCCAGSCCDEDERHRLADPMRGSGSQEVVVKGTEQRPTGRTSNPVHRGGCQCLCEHLMARTDQKDCGLCEIEDPCAKVRVDLRHGVPLACVSLREGECGDWYFDRNFEACGPRRLVKRNDLLFDLIQGCDLTRISAIGWAPWHRETGYVDWDEFEASFGELPEEASVDYQQRKRNNSKRQKVPVITSLYWVRFSRPVLRNSVRPDCFAMTVLYEEREGGWDAAFRVPILDVHTESDKDTPPGYINKAYIVVDGGWLGDAVHGNKTIFNEDPTTVEIEVRGDLIVDCNGQTVDANPHGLLPAPTGNGTPGGSFFSSFRVQPRYEEYRIKEPAPDAQPDIAPKELSHEY